MRSSFSTYMIPVCVVLMYLFLYIPIITLIIFSFNDSSFTYAWKGFTLRWYKDLWHAAEVWDACKNSFIVAISSVILSLVMGTLLVFYGVHSYLSRSFILFYGSVAIPEIVLAVGLLSFFSLLSMPLGLTTLIAGHTLLGLGYVVPILAARFSELDYALTEASLDLGATRSQTFWKIIFPITSPAIIASALFVFIISWDDFLISFFCSGADTPTLSLYIFSMIRSGSLPMVNALATVLLALSSFLVLLFLMLRGKNAGMER